ncbi:hypothetical protein EMCG_04153 [[Emmonsia] crescens]|uniref:Sialidase domain-containing protein n=1 Tax=[Emmonsia] crescens TaxID=73230 RepID=A0A0G2HU23_9EURO|nr:hypothetical protein EMCG_04153 [Emmonsia crescens UAMH 3008]
MLVKSTDQGDTWSTPEAVLWQENHRDGMNGIARMKDGSQDALVMALKQWIMLLSLMSKLLYPMMMEQAGPILSSELSSNKKKFITISVT